MVRLLRALLAAFCAFSSLASALLPITVDGNMFVDSNGDPFVIVGVDYQPGGSSGYTNSASSDVLSDEDVCLRDAFLLQKLGVNTIRTYTVSPWLNHDACMSILNSVGIYVILDVNSPLDGESIHRDDPAGSYNEGYLKRVFSIIDAFMGYPNLLGFFAGNEVINAATSASVSPPYIRAVQRDIKNYISLHANRTIPVGYSAADDNQLRVAGWEYFQCKTGDEDLDISRSDFYGLNSYQWCSGRDNFQTSGYGVLETTFANSTIPLFFSEYGCNIVQPRTFTEVNGGVYTDSMLQVFDGGLIYEYSEEANNYGLVTIGSDGSVVLKQDYINLQNAYEILTYTSFMSKSFIDTSRSSKCNASFIENIDSSFNASLSLPNCPAEDMLKSGSGNNNIGKWIPLNSTQTAYKVYDVDEQEITDTEITVVSDQTQPEAQVSATTSAVRSATSVATSTATGSSTSSSIVATTSASASATSSSAAASTLAGAASPLLLAVTGLLGITLAL
ncbi:Glucanosyltransferase-domain-containing protein [Lipomyces tetrasporus]|uniref:1,3-beta-glucanosyltransferase n=1 Tax=Lipomyces tetrasporus TaxID=54092 RepID=A0AAD7QMC4_9ASCO|nr:Glucanosyltransferase-domain-containing protein [Lipomyces tetrasporus]KAJ8097713.1 Glucanosyltransferase-domain-containing protein [Lipomyces tetrasporus]